MALQISFQFPLLHPTKLSPKNSYLPKIKLTSIFTKPIIKHATITRRGSTQFRIKATRFTNNKSEEEEENPESNISQTQVVGNESQPQPTNSNIWDSRSQIKKVMKERELRERRGGGGDFWSGVAEEIREIEWPAFGKVVGTTGVVLGVIAGSSVVLLTVNAVLTELSDQIFAGKGVQDFLG